MTRFDPSVKIERLKLFSGGVSVYDETFHQGLNIIRSETNSCGKSSIMNFIFYILGGEVPEWVDAAKRIGFGLLQVALNGVSYTLKREIGEGVPPCYLFEGPLEESEEKQSGWTKYGHKKTDTTKSFSQVIFEALDFPEIKADAKANVTFNQILRLIYCDQQTSVNRIFKFANFDKEIMRRTIIELLLGIDDLQLLEKRLLLQEKEKKMSEVKGSIRSLYDTLRQIYSIDEFKDDWVDVQVQKLEEEIDGIQAEIAEIVNNKADEKIKRKNKEVKELEAQIIQVRHDLAEKKETLAELVYEIEDSSAFIASLNERRSALENAILVKEIIGPLEFIFCPVCMSEIKEAESNGHCSLCKAELNENSKHFNRMKARNEIDFQLRESKNLLETRNDKQVVLEAEIAKLGKIEKKLTRDYDAYKSLPNYVDSEVWAKMNRKGYIESKIERLEENRKLGGLLQSRLEEKSMLAGEISILTDEIKLLGKDQEDKWNGYHRSIGGFVKEFLQQDLDYQDEFKNPEKVEVHFDKDTVLVDGNSKFSASSDVVLKNSLFLALLKLSCIEKDLRFPRFLLLDNIEDKGMVPDRSANFQKIVAGVSEEYRDIQHQIILTTSMIDSGLDGTALCVGEKYSSTIKAFKFPADNS